MGLLDKALDKAFGNNTTYLTYDKLAEFVKNEFITSNDPKYLKKLEKAVKGGKYIDSPSKKYVLDVSTTNFFKLFALVAPKRDVLIREANTKNYYQLDSSKNWKKFYKAIMADINAAK